MSILCLCKPNSKCAIWQKDVRKLCLHRDKSLNGRLSVHISIRLPVLRNQMLLAVSCHSCINTSRLRRNWQHFADDIFKSIFFFNENVWILINISYNICSHGSINNIPALVWIMARRLPGDKPLSSPLMVSVPTHICVSSRVKRRVEFHLSRALD